MVGVTGIEPVTSSLSGMRSNQLSYTPFVGKGIVTSLTITKKVVEVNGIEPMTS